MYIDAQLRLSGGQALAGTGTVVSTNNVDLLSANRNIGRGQPMRLVVTVDTTLAGGTGLTVEYIQSANADMSAPDVLGTFTAPATPALPVCTMGCNRASPRRRGEGKPAVRPAALRPHPPHGRCPVATSGRTSASPTSRGRRASR